MSILPAHVDEGALWTDWFDGARSLIEIAIAHTIPLETLIEWATSPQFRAVCDGLREVAARRAEDLTALAAAGAITALAAQTTADPETPLEARILESRRKAAAALLPRSAGRCAAGRATEVAPSDARSDTPHETIDEPPPPPESDLGASTADVERATVHATAAEGDASGALASLSRAPWERAGVRATSPTPSPCLVPEDAIAPAQATAAAFMQAGSPPRAATLRQRAGATPAPT